MTFSCKLDNKEDLQTYKQLVAFCTQYSLRVHKEDHRDGTSTISVEPLAAPHPFEVADMIQAYTLLEDYIINKFYEARR